MISICGSTPSKNSGWRTNPGSKRSMALPSNILFSASRITLAQAIGAISGHNSKCITAFSFTVISMIGFWFIFIFPLSHYFFRGSTHPCMSLFVFHYTAFAEILKVEVTAQILLRPGWFFFPGIIEFTIILLRYTCKRFLHLSGFCLCVTNKVIWLFVRQNKIKMVILHFIDCILTGYYDLCVKNKWQHNKNKKRNTEWRVQNYFGM